MHQNHPNLSDEINANIAKSEIDGGVWIRAHGDHVSAEIKAQPVLPAGKGLLITTQNRVYTLRKLGPEEFTLEGHPKYCPVPTKAYIAGSTWGGSMLKVGFVGRGMHLEFGTDVYGTVITSEIKDIQEIA